MPAAFCFGCRHALSFGARPHLSSSGCAHSKTVYGEALRAAQFTILSSGGTELVEMGGTASCTILSSALTRAAMSMFSNLADHSVRSPRLADSSILAQLYWDAIGIASPHDIHMPSPLRLN
jgi:autotransporter passenger strand-loop-strand repeat protein